MTRYSVLLLASACLTGCVSMPEGERVDYDPWERANRGMYQVNDVIDRATTRPVARAYNAVVPEPVRQGVTNFGQNLMTPSSSLNNFLQGKPRDGFGELLRFIINSSAGIGGLFDIASGNGLTPKTEDFGQTAAVWGVPDGPYVMLPFRGPRTLRDAVLMPLDLLADPLLNARLAADYLRWLERRYDGPSDKTYFRILKSAGGNDPGVLWEWTEDRQRVGSGGFYMQSFIVLFNNLRHYRVNSEFIRT